MTKRGRTPGQAEGDVRMVRQRGGLTGRSLGENPHFRAGGITDYHVPSGSLEGARLGRESSEGMLTIMRPTNEPHSQPRMPASLIFQGDPVVVLG
jgi:hypothetical protein